MKITPLFYKRATIWQAIAILFLLVVAFEKDGTEEMKPTKITTKKKPKIDTAQCVINSQNCFITIAVSDSGKHLKN